MSIQNALDFIKIIRSSESLRNSVESIPEGSLGDWACTEGNKLGFEFTEQEFLDAWSIDWGMRAFSAGK